MSLPDLPTLLAAAVDGEDVVAHVDLGGEDLLVVSPTRTFVYRADGLLSDESVKEYPHDIERIDVSKGRRKAKLTLEYGLDGTKKISVPASRLDDALHPVLAGVLAASGVTDPGESVLETFRFSELTLIVTSDRLVKHVGSAVWDEEYDEFHYDDVTDLHFEEGTVATSIVLTHNGRQERFKAPNETERQLREALSDAVCAYHDVGSLAELRLTMEDRAADDEEGTDSEAESASGPADFGDGLTPLSASPGSDAADAAAEAADTADTVDAADAANAGGTSDVATADAGNPVDGAETADGRSTSGGETADPLAAEGRRSTVGGESTSSAGESGSGTLAESSGEAVASGASATDADDGFGESGFEPAVEGDGLAEEVAALRQAVETQSEQLDRQTELIQQLIEELRRGR